MSYYSELPIKDFDDILGWGEEFRVVNAVIPKNAILFHIYGIFISPKVDFYLIVNNCQLLLYIPKTNEKFVLSGRKYSQGSQYLVFLTQR